MKNPEQGSSTAMVGQNAHTFPVLTTVNAPLTPSQAEKAARFMGMVTAKTAPDVAQDQPQEQVAPRCKSYQELAAERAERRARSKAHSRPKAKKAAPPATWLSKAGAVLEPQEERPAWLITVEELAESLKQQVIPNNPTPKLRKQVQRQPVPLLADLLDLKKYRPTRGRGYGTAGAGALAELLYEKACTALAYRLYLYDEETGKPPKQIVLHLSAEMIQASLGISENTLRDWTAQLVEDGFLYARAHKTTATFDEKILTMVDGMLYAVRLAPGHKARLRWEDYKKQYRDLDADRAAGRTAYNAIQNAQRRAEQAAELAQQEAQNLEAVPEGEKNTAGSETFKAQVQAELREQLRRWAVIPGNVTLENPLNPDPAVFSPEEVAERLNGVQDVVYLLPTLSAAHHTKRAALVGIMAATLSRALNDQHSRLYWCKVIWQAWQEELEGRDGLQHLAAQLQRLEIDRREWGELRNPAAVFAARQRAV